MRYRRVGTSGLRVSVVSLGTWLTFGASIDKARSNAIVRTALDGGVNFFDTADGYAEGQGELALGEALSGITRRHYVLATKCFFPMSSGVNDRGLSRKHIVESCNASLVRMRADYIDLYQCHRFDPETPLSETVRALGDLIAMGKVLYWGVSQWTSEQMRDGLRVADELGVSHPISNQLRYNMLDRSIEADVLSTCADLGIGVLAYSPLAQGVLTGKYRHGVPHDSRAADEEMSASVRSHLSEKRVAEVDGLADVAKEFNVPLARLALVWCLRQRIVATVITGASTAEQLSENLRAADMDADPKLLQRIDELMLA